MESKVCLLATFITVIESHKREPYWWWNGGLWEQPDRTQCLNTATTLRPPVEAVRNATIKFFLGLTTRPRRTALTGLFTG